MNAESFEQLAVAAYVGRRFALVRDDDVSGVSGTGVVAEGIEFCDGSVAYKWHTDRDRDGTMQYAECVDGIDVVERIHGHDGRTRIVWVDGDG